MKQRDVKALIQNSSHRPLRICMDDGKAYRISHPDFALAAPDAVVLVSGPGHAFGASFVICDFAHISRLEIQDQPNPKTKT